MTEYAPADQITELEGVESVAISTADSGSGADSDISERRVPALARLAFDARERRRELLEGFGSAEEPRAEVLRWAVSVTGSLLGRTPEGFLEQLYRDFRVAKGERAPAMLAALIDAEESDVPADLYPEIRRRIAANALAPAYSEAFRTLRADAQEHAPSRDGDNSHPEKERHAAMRPSLSAIEEHQANTLEALLSGFGSREAVAEWVDVLELATHGEIPENYGRDLLMDRSALEAFLGESETHKREREIAAAFLLRHFRAGVRERFSRAAEISDRERSGNRSNTI